MNRRTFATRRVPRFAMNDAVGQLQEEVNHLCALMYNYTGSLQRDAPPVSLRNDANGTVLLRRKGS